VLLEHVLVVTQFEEVDEVQVLPFTQLHPLQQTLTIQVQVDALVLDGFQQLSGGQCALGYRPADGIEDAKVEGDFVERNWI